VPPIDDFPRTIPTRCWVAADAAEVYVDACEQNQPGFEVVVYLRPGECGLSASEARALARHLIAAADAVDDVVEMVEP